MHFLNREGGDDGKFSCFYIIDSFRRERRAPLQWNKVEAPMRKEGRLNESR
jgi:hypothetical protein